MIPLIAASLVTDPACKVRENYYSLFFPDQDMWVKAAAIARMIFFTLLVPFALVGMALRGIVSLFTNVILEIREGLVTEGSEITLFSANVALMPAGYAITDAGLSLDRLDAICDQVNKQEADVVCLYEVPDIRDAMTIAEKTEYPYVIPVAGVRAVGPNSMMYVASRRPIEEVKFHRFEEDEISGRAASSEKGILAIKIKDFGWILSTHMQHSEVPSAPEEHEERSRSKQKAKLLKLANELGAKCLVGDFNMSEKELGEMPGFTRDLAVVGKSTWGGDGWCARLMNKIASRPLTLDYVFVADGLGVQSTLIDPGFDGERFLPDALSDHWGFKSRIWSVAGSNR